VIRYWLSAFPLRDLCDLLLNFRKCLASCGRGMLDYNTKFDRRESATVLGVEEIRELVSSFLNGSEIESVSLLTGGFINSN
jgi:hypothetical protein